MDVATHAPGTFCWVELGTTDKPAARRFYEALFGWTAQEYPIGPDESYAIVRQSGRDVGGIYGLRADQRTQGVPTHWLCYISVANADAAAALVVPAGGTLMGPAFDVGTNGRMAVAADPTGAMFALWQPTGHAGSGIGAVPGSVSWFELASTDAAVARTFYTKLFGWSWQEYPGMSYHVAMLGEARVGGLMPLAGDESKGIPSHWMIYFEVADCDERANWVASNGGAVVVPPTDIPSVGRFAVLRDPQGGVFSIIKSAARTS